LQREIKINSSKYGFALRNEDGVSACVKTISEYYFKSIKEKQQSETNKTPSTSQSPIQSNSETNNTSNSEKSITPIRENNLTIEQTNIHIHVQ
jgi:hypothetical protein